MKVKWRYSACTVGTQYLHSAVRSSSSFSREMFVSSFVLMISRRSSVIDSNIMYSRVTLGYSGVHWRNSINIWQSDLSQGRCLSPPSS